MISLYTSVSLVELTLQVIVVCINGSGYKLKAIHLLLDIKKWQQKWTTEIYTSVAEAYFEIHAIKMCQKNV